jgi:ferric-dicitrate binding protein FerR (iron transport regulator)
MSMTKQMFDDYISSEEFDLMFDDEYEQWLQQKQKEQEAYEEMLEINSNFAQK